MNTGESWPDVDTAWLRVQRMQTKLHQWAVDDPDLTAGLMICSTSSTTRTSARSPGNG